LLLDTRHSDAAELSACRTWQAANMTIEPGLAQQSDTAETVSIAGWTFTVTADGRQAEVRAQDGIVVTALSGGTATLSLPDVEPPSDGLDAGPPPRWDVDLAELILRRARPVGSVFVRALVDQGGTATAEKLREMTGLDVLNQATLALTRAASAVFSKGDRHRRGRYRRHFFAARTHPDQPRGRVYDYYLPEELVPLFAEALTRLGR
jgi:hypothetical protein